MTIPAFTGPELCAREAHEIVELLRKREVSPAELVEAAFSRIEAAEAYVNAIPTLCRERAERAGAAVSDDHADEPGWLGGLPIAIKDLTEVAGVPMTMGTAGLAEYVPENSDPLVRRLEARGGIVVGKSNTPEFGAGARAIPGIPDLMQVARLAARLRHSPRGRCRWPRDWILPVPCAHRPPIAAWSGCDQVLALGDTFRYDVLVYMSFLLECWAQIASTNPLERVNREVKRSTDVKASSPTTPPSCASSVR